MIIIYVIFLLQLSAFIRLRTAECSMPKLQVSIFNKERNESFRLEMLEQVCKLCFLQLLYNYVYVYHL